MLLRRGTAALRLSSTAMSKVTGGRWSAWEGRHALDPRTGRVLSAPSCPGSVLRRGAHHARRSQIVRRRLRLRQPRVGRAQQIGYVVRYGVGNQTLYRDRHVTADRQRTTYLRHGRGGAPGPGRYTALERCDRLSPVDSYIGHRRRRRRRSGRTLRRCMEGKAQLLRCRNPRLPAPIREQASQFPPGEGCRYCNCGYVLLGLLIETISGMTYRDYVRANVFAEARMTASDFFRMDRVNHNVAEGCDPTRDASGQIVGWKKNIYSFPPIGSPDAGAYVTVTDLDRFLRAVIAGKLLSPELASGFLSPQVVHSRRESWTEMYGYGLRFYVDRSGKVFCFEKEGINVGVSGIISHFPDQDITATLISNMEDGVWDPASKIHEMVVEGRMT